MIVVSVMLLLCSKNSGNNFWIILNFWLQNLYYLTLLVCRSLVQNLEKVDPSRMKREEKLAFWINIHNALVMHVSKFFFFFFKLHSQFSCDACKYTFICFFLFPCK